MHVARSIPSALIAAFALLSTSLGLGDRVQPSVASAQGPRTFELFTGAESPDSAVQVLQFFPDAVVPAIGDTLVWRNNTAEAHTVTFLPKGQPAPIFDMNNPEHVRAQGNNRVDGRGYLNSGLMQKNDQYTAVAGEAGTYTYICLLHKKQVGTVTVVPPGANRSALTPPPAPSTASADPVITAWQSNAAAYQPTSTRKDDGSTQYKISGGMGDGTAAVMRFLPGTLDIRVGDTVVWENTDADTPHTVTFGAPQGPIEDTWGNPTAFDGIAPLNSGFIGPGRRGGETFAVTFTAPGSFSYVCALHTSSSMVGTINVTGGEASPPVPADVPSAPAEPAPSE
jgi:plastocyanin